MKNFFKKKRVLITGNTGFKGSWLSLWMCFLGAKVLGISSGLSSNPSNFEILNLKKKINYKKIDIRKFNNLYYEVKKFQPDFIFHFAAEAIVKQAYINPRKTWETNTIGTVNLLECLRKIKKKTIAVIITSDKVYKNIEINRGYTEKDILGGFDPYSASKASADLAAQSYFNSYIKYKKNIKLSIARAGNVIGGGDWSSGRIIPDCVKNWSKNRILKIRNPYSTRPWQHVLDVLYGYILLAINLKKNKKLNGEIFNFGPQIEKNSRVIDLVKIMQSNWKGSKWKITNTNNFPESKLLFLNSNKAKKKINWKSSLNIKESLLLTIGWYKEYYFNRKNIFRYSMNQIKDFKINFY